MIVGADFYFRIKGGTLSIKCIEQQKEAGSNLLQELRKIDPFAMIAGGAPRDWYFDTPAKDLDIYLRMPNHNTVSLVLGLLERIGVKQAKSLDKKSENSNYANLPHLKWVFEGYFSDIKVNIMVMEQGVLEGIIKDFDVAICKAWFDGKECHYTEDFEFCVKTRVCLVHKNYSGKESHIRKMAKRFPQFIFCKKLEIDVEDEGRFDLPAAQSGLPSFPDDF